MGSTSANAALLNRLGPTEWCREPWSAGGCRCPAFDSPSGSLDPLTPCSTCRHALVWHCEPLVYTPDEVRSARRQGYPLFEGCKDYGCICPCFVEQARDRNFCAACGHKNGWHRASERSAPGASSYDGEGTLRSWPQNGAASPSAGPSSPHASPRPGDLEYYGGEIRAHPEHPRYATYDPYYGGGIASGHPPWTPTDPGGGGPPLPGNPRRAQTMMTSSSGSDRTIRESTHRRRASPQAIRPLATRAPTTTSPERIPRGDYPPPPPPTLASSPSPVSHGQDDPEFWGRSPVNHSMHLAGSPRQAHEPARLPPDPRRPQPAYGSTAHARGRSATADPTPPPFHPDEVHQLGDVSRRSTWNGRHQLPSPFSGEDDLRAGLERGFPPQKPMADSAPRVPPSPASSSSDSGPTSTLSERSNRRDVIQRDPSIRSYATNDEDRFRASPRPPPHHEQAASSSSGHSRPSVSSDDRSIRSLGSSMSRVSLSSVECQELFHSRQGNLMLSISPSPTKAGAFRPGTRLTISVSLGRNHTLEKFSSILFSFQGISSFESTAGLGPDSHVFVEEKRTLWSQSQRSIIDDIGSDPRQWPVTFVIPERTTCNCRTSRRLPSTFAEQRAKIKIRYELQIVAQRQGGLIKGGLISRSDDRISVPIQIVSPPVTVIGDSSTLQRVMSHRSTMSTATASARLETRRQGDWMTVSLPSLGPSEQQQPRRLLGCELRWRIDADHRAPSDVVFTYRLVFLLPLNATAAMAHDLEGPIREAKVSVFKRITLSWTSGASRGSEQPFPQTNVKAKELNRSILPTLERMSSEGRSELAIMGTLQIPKAELMPVDACNAEIRLSIAANLGDGPQLASLGSARGRPVVLTAALGNVEPFEPIAMPTNMDDQPPPSPASPSVARQHSTAVGLTPTSPPFQVQNPDPTPPTSPSGSPTTSLRRPPTYGGRRTLSPIRGDREEEEVLADPAGSPVGYLNRPRSLRDHPETDGQTQEEWTMVPWS